MKRNEFGLYEKEIDYNDPKTWLRSKDTAPYGRPLKPPAAPPSYPVPNTYTNTLVWHEAAHAIVGHRLGMTVQFIDMSGLLLPVPLCGLDEATVPEDQRTRARGIAALAGPIGECWTDDTKHPQWRQDGDVARAAAKDLAADTGEQMMLLIEWSRFAGDILAADPAYEPLVKMLERKRTLTGDEFRVVVDSADRIRAGR